MVVAKLVELSLLTPEILGLNTVTGKFYLLSTVLKRRKSRKRGREWPNVKTSDIKSPWPPR